MRLRLAVWNWLTNDVRAGTQYRAELNRQRDVLKKQHRCLLLEIKAAVHRTAGVYQQSELYRQVRFALEVHNRLWRFVIIQNTEILFVQIAHELAVPVRRGEQNIDLIHPCFDGEDGVVRLVTCISRGS